MSVIFLAFYRIRARSNADTFYNIPVRVFELSFFRKINILIENTFNGVFFFFYYYYSLKNTFSSTTAASWYIASPDDIGRSVAIDVEKTGPDK